MLKPGDRFGDYKVIRLLGQGGMGSVFLLENAEGIEVAAKILDPATAGDHESRRRFLREAELALGVKHPNLVETYDVGEDPDTGLCYILMEYVSGGSLADYLKEHGALPVEDAVAVVQAMASVLELVRQKGIVHRDIKPGNIMFDAEGTPKLADLGIARGGIGGTETTTVTQTGMMIGTPAYMAPEQMLDAHKVDTRADIYSLGVVFFEMLTGERPNKDDTVVQLMARAVKGEPLPDVRTLRPEVSASLAQLLNMMVAPDKDGRISTPGQITSALDIIARGGTFAAKPMVRASFPDGRARTPAAPQANRDRKPFPGKVLFPVALLAGLAAAFAVLAPKRELVKSHVTTNVIERVVEKVAVRTSVVERVAGGIRETARRNEGASPSVDKSAEKSEAHGFSLERISDSRRKAAGNSFGWLENPPAPDRYARILAFGMKGHLVGKKRMQFQSYFSTVDSGNPVMFEVNDELQRRDFSGVKLVFLWSRDPREPYSEAELKRLTEYMENGGNIMVFSNDPRGAQAGLLRQFGLGVENTPRSFSMKAVCPALEGLSEGWCARGRGIPLADDSPWSPMVVTRDEKEGIVMAVRSVGRGKLIFVASGNLTSYAGSGTNRGWWSRVLQGCGIAIRDPLPVQEKRTFDPEKLRDPDSTRAVQKALDAVFPGWKVSAVEQQGADAADWTVGYQPSWRGEKDVVTTMPPNMETPTVISRRVEVGKGHPVLNLEVASQNVDVDFLLSVRVSGKTVLEPRLICTPEDSPYARIQVPLSAYRGRKVLIEIVHAANNWFYEHAFWRKIEIVEGTGRESAGIVGVRRMEVFPAANPDNVKWLRRTPWRYTEKAPGDSWKTPSFDDSRWRKSAKAFGRDAGSRMSVAERWQGERIWLRRSFSWDVPKPVYNAVFSLCFDQDVEIFLNGTQVLKRDGWNTGWDLHAADRTAFAGALRQGENVLAVTLNGDGSSFFDCGLVVETLDRELQDAWGSRQDKGPRYTEEGLLEEPVFDAARFADRDSTRRVQKTLDALFPGWKTTKNAEKAVHPNEEIGYISDICGRHDVLATLPPSRQSPVRLTRTMVVPEGAKLSLAVRKNPTAGGGLMLEVYANGKRRWEGVVTDGEWFEHAVDLSDLAGKKARLEVRHMIHPDFGNARALWSDLSVR